MADAIEDKNSLIDRLEEDRRKMAIQVGELKQDYNVSNRLRASIQKYPWPWLAGSLLTGYLLSHLPERRKVIYSSPDPRQRAPSNQAYPESPGKKNRLRATNKIWSLVKPIISAYIGRELYNRVERSRRECRRPEPG
jgi:hypothetical protein